MGSDWPCSSCVHTPDQARWGQRQGALIRQASLHRVGIGGEFTEQCSVSLGGMGPGDGIPVSDAFSLMVDATGFLSLGEN